MNIETLAIGLVMLVAGLLVAIVILQIEINRLNSEMLVNRGRIRRVAKASHDLADVFIKHLESEKDSIVKGMKNAE